MKIVKNERSWAIDLIGIINQSLSNKHLKIKQAGGEVTINNSMNKITQRKIMFPDLLLYEDTDKVNIVQGWEIKLPDVSITDAQFILDAQQKAEVLNLNSALLWNFNSAVLYVKQASGLWEIYHTWNDLNHIMTREDVGKFQSDWISLLERVLIELNEFLISGKIESSKLDYVISESILANMLKRNQILVSKNLQEISKSNRLLDIFLKEWWKEASTEYEKDEPTAFSAYSKLIISNWLIKLTFAHLIKTLHNPAFVVEEIKDGVSPEEANNIFKSLTEQIDFYTIFKPLEYNNLIDESTWKDIKEYNNFLTQQKIGELDHSILQTMLEQSVNSSRKEVIGQFTTPVILARLLVNSTIIDSTSNVIDPCCGSGTIAKAVLEFKKQRIDEKNAHETTWASDKFEYPLQIANLALTDVSSIDIPNKVFTKNVFSLVPGEAIEIVSPRTGELVNYEIPQFKSVVSNLPFVSFENITEDEKSTLNNLRQAFLERYGIELSQRSDLYTYITLYISTLLEEKGKLGLILSNSWLGTNSGKEFFEVLQQLYSIDYVLISGNKRWFKNAEVVTTLLVLTKNSSMQSSPDNLIRFGILRKDLEELDESDLIDEISNHIIANTSVDQDTLKTSSYTPQSISELQQLGVSLNTLFHDVDWVLEIKDKLTPLTSKFDIIRGMRRGWDPMFYPEAGHGIEEEYIQPVLKNSRNIKRLNTVANNDAFCCSDSLETIKSKNNLGALSWINKFKGQNNKVGKPLVEILQKSAAVGAHWYEMNTNSQAEIVTTLNADKKLFWAKLNEKSFINQRLIGISLKNDSIDLDISHALLNSLIGAFFIEGVGFGRGLGVLDLSATNISKAYMLNPDLLSDINKEDILTKFSTLASRDIKPFIEEIEETDRQDFELAVLDAYGLSSYYDRIKATVISLQKTRLTAKEV